MRPTQREIIATTRRIWDSAVGVLVGTKMNKNEQSKFINCFYEIYYAIKDNQENLDILFQNLDDMVSSRKNMSDQKHKNKWVRLFAIMIEPNHYIITGGAIKLSEKLENHPTTLNELQKLKTCQTYFFNKKVKDIDTFFEIIL